MSEGNTKCKLYGNCPEFTTVDKCTTGCDYYNPKNPDEEIDIPEEVIAKAEAEERPEIKLIFSDLPKFDKIHEFFVMKKHVFMMQSISPKKIILKYKRRLKDTDKLNDGCYIFRNQKNELLEPEKVFKKFDRQSKEKLAKAGAEIKAKNTEKDK